MDAATSNQPPNDPTHHTITTTPGSAPPHPYFVAAQFHPEFQSRPTQPSPLFLGLLRAAAQRREALAAAGGVAA